MSRVSVTLYRLPKARPNAKHALAVGAQSLAPGPLELIDRLVVLIPVLSSSKGRRHAAIATVTMECSHPTRLRRVVTERTSAQQILTHLGEPPVAPPLAPPEPQSKGRALPGSETDYDQPPACDIEVEPVPDINFDQRHGW